ncbi:uncharacterized protein MELLADRAFT_92371 [Melampsora larici-populina 98AG31]|uniref:Uncharacterized protein n=1 Tax=Melampsora larici-populina (strain 98AG31 / pathotype 3-4-7) TaxID=747676 RepID=F4R9D7_MELLP|nr:uncharacterized protein MELLADRAFT_92371 [Melampsora larici-populina 98AG31]EGG11174.1 hypothetical protein MELLADRAFT_92371 [Melampsora larici-populina 98AG31]
MDLPASSNASIAGDFDILDFAIECLNHLPGQFEETVQLPSGALLEPIGTPARTEFDKLHEVLIRVSFKLEFEKQVNATEEKTDGVKDSNSKEKKIINSKDLSSDGEDPFFRASLYGKSFDDFKDLCVGVSLNILERLRPLDPTDEFEDLIWKGRVGKKELTLDSFSAFVEFVNRIYRSNCKTGDVLIRSPNVAEKKKQANAKIDQMLEFEKTMLVRGFPKANVLTAPWDPNFYYQLALFSSNTWAIAIMNGTATPDMPPDSVEYREYMAACRRPDRSIPPSSLPYERRFKRPRPQNLVTEFGKRVQR